ncbi:MAG TPA: hydantoinase B/oxoprolinase family protein [Acidobacteriota bacterium]|nr:hydantoinase B/oxoprolinase family protein [Acidobacteriota bacterium]
MKARGYDPIRMEIFKSLFTSVAEEMGVTLRRTAFSPNIKERRDYSCAIFDGRGQLVAQGDHMPVHLGSMPMSVLAAVHAVHIERGDIVILNDPYEGGTHLPDVTMVSAVFPNGEVAGTAPLFYVANRAHHSDIGGMTPGSMPLSTEIFQEGLRIPPLKLFEGGRRMDAIFRLLLANVRTPGEREGDLTAQIASNRTGERRLLQISDRYGAAVAGAYAKHLQDYSERMVRNFLRHLPQGRFSAEDFLDDDGISDRPVRIRAAITIRSGELEVDFSGTDAQVGGSVNAVYAITMSAVYYVVRSLIPEPIPASSGVLRPIRIIAPEGSVVHARFPAAVAAGNVETSQRIVDVLLRAFGSAIPQRIPAASSGTMNNLSFGGVDPRDGSIFSYYETIAGGMGATSRGDGNNGIHTHMTNSLNTPVEALEYSFPLRILRYSLRRNSGGVGKYRGGAGIVREIESLTEADATILSDRRKFRPYGLAGGRPGKPGRTMIRGGANAGRLASKSRFRIGPGQCLRVETPGGGGWGKP